METLSKDTNRSNSDANWISDEHELKDSMRISMDIACNPN